MERAQETGLLSVCQVSHLSHIFHPPPVLPPHSSQTCVAESLSSAAVSPRKDASGAAAIPSDMKGIAAAKAADVSVHLCHATKNPF